MRLVIQANVRSFEDTDEENGNFTPALKSTETVADGFDRDCHSKFSIDAEEGVSPENELDLSFGDVDAVKGFWIEADGPFSLIFNGGAEEIDFVATSSVAGTAVRAFMPCAVSAIKVINHSATAVLKGRYHVYGDPTA